MGPRSEAKDVIDTKRNLDVEIPSSVLLSDWMVMAGGDHLSIKLIHHLRYPRMHAWHQVPQPTLQSIHVTHFVDRGLVCLEM